MYSVRIDKDGAGYVFSVFEVPASERATGLVALDSAPGIIAMVHAVDPGAAAARAWELGAHMYDENRLLELIGKP